MQILMVIYPQNCNSYGYKSNTQIVLGKRHMKTKSHSLNTHDNDCIQEMGKCKWHKSLNTTRWERHWKSLLTCKGNENLSDTGMKRYKGLKVMLLCQFHIWCTLWLCRMKQETPNILSFPCIFKMPIKFVIIEKWERVNHQKPEHQWWTCSYHEFLVKFSWKLLLSPEPIIPFVLDKQ